MPTEQSKVRTCGECGVAISREDFLNHAAARYKGKLLCPQCVQEVKARIVAAKAAAGAAETDIDPTEVPIALVSEDDIEDTPDAGAQIHGFSGAEMTVRLAERQYRRPLLQDSPLATRCETFHCKLTDVSLHHLNEQVNQWVDDHPDVQIKFALSNIGVVEGKHADPHLIVTIFY